MCHNWLTIPCLEGARHHNVEAGVEQQQLGVPCLAGVEQQRREVPMPVAEGVAEGDGRAAAAIILLGLACECGGGLTSEVLALINTPQAPSSPVSLSQFSLLDLVSPYVQLMKPLASHKLAELPVRRIYRVCFCCVFASLLSPHLHLCFVALVWVARQGGGST